MSRVTTQSSEGLPWYKQNWLWFVLSIPIASVILSSIMIYFALTGEDSLVNDNYYKDGLAINRKLEQDQKADQLGLRPELLLSDLGEISVKIDPAKLARQPFLQLRLIHPTIGDQDQTIKLLPAESDYRGELAGAASLTGRWYLELSNFDQSWRIREEVFMPLQQHTLNRD